MHSLTVKIFTKVKEVDSAPQHISMFKLKHLKPVCSNKTTQYGFNKKDYSIYTPIFCISIMYR